MIFFYDNCADYSSCTQKYDESFNDIFPTSSVTAANGSNGICLQADSGFGTQANVTKRFPVTRSNGIFAARCYPTGKVVLCVFYDYTVSSGVYTYTNQVDFRIDTSGFIVATRNGTVLGTSSSAVSFNAKHYFEFRTVIDATAGQIEVKVDGVSILSLTSQNTRNTANSYFNAIGFGCINGGYGGATTYWSDIVMVDNTGSAPANTFMGDLQVKYLGGPTGDGGTNQFTMQAASWVATTYYQLNAVIIDTNGNLQKCSQKGTSSSSVPTWGTGALAVTNDNGAKWTNLGTPAHFKYVGTVTAGAAANPADGQSYLSDSTVGDTELFAFPALSSTLSIVAVGVGLRGYKDQTYGRSLRAVASNGGTTVDNGSDMTLTLATTFNTGNNSNNGTVSTGSAVRGDAVFPTDPSTGAAWANAAAVNTASFGFKISA
jgi:hypothetical protein